MNLTELKEKPINELVEMAEAMGIENVARSRKQDVIFSLLKRHAKSGEEISGDGVLEILSDGFGFLRSADSSYLAGPDDIYVSPSQIRRFNLRTGDTISGKIRPPKDGERYFALLKVSDVNFSGSDTSRTKVLFENLTALFPQEPAFLLSFGEQILSVSPGSDIDEKYRLDKFESGQLVFLYRPMDMYQTLTVGNSP